ncbi:MAG: Fe-Mn family superoxide dismutase [Chloroflexi bacterium]|nr:Fe-Mn family superoxide dismutase [Chloroflexota bacterium]
MANPHTYQQRSYKLTGLNGISDRQIDAHLGLYAGYVKNTNLLNEKIAELVNQGKTGTPDWAELVRRLGFEYNGLLLHEYYFGSLKSPGGGPGPFSIGGSAPAAGNQLDPNSQLGQAIQQNFGSVQDWLASFKAIASMRGVGWAILYQDPVTGWLSNQWVTLHQDGHPAGFKPILVLDVWEHAFMVDYLPPERSKYIDAFFNNLDWSVVEQRLSQPTTTR